MHHSLYLAHLYQDRDFFQSGPAAGHSHAVSARPNLATPSSILLVPLAFSPCPESNGGIDLLADWFIGMLVIAIALGNLDVEWGIDKVPCGEGLLDYH